MKNKVDKETIRPQLQQREQEPLSKHSDVAEKCGFSETGRVRLKMLRKNRSEKD